MENSKLFKVLTISLALFVTHAQAGTETTVPVVNGMLIEMEPGVLQTLKIRVQSLGPGFCAVRVRFADSTVNLSAPPLSWSDWFSVGPAIDGSSHSLSFAPQCSTGAVGEARYFRRSRAG